MRPGDVVVDRFRIEHEAGAGAMGVVFRARDLQTGEAVALKILKRSKSSTARFQREAKVLAQLRHPAIVRYVAHGTTPDDTMYLAMEWLDGDDLEERLAKGALPAADALFLARRIADALSFAHARGIVHRDLKPSNLFLPGGDVREAKLLDFGIARVQNATFRMTGAGAVIGTPGYMAPEQARGDAALDARADVFSLGAVLYECLTGRAAFIAENLVALLAKILIEEPSKVSELRAGVPPEIDALLARLLAKAPADRPVDGAAARDAIALVEPLAKGIATTTTSSSRPSAITRGEQHVVSVVIAAAAGETRAIARGPSTEVLADDENGSLPIGIEELASLDESAKTKIVDAAQLAATQAADPPTEPIIDALVRQGARVERLADGALVAALHGAGAATDQAARAARCALTLRRHLPAANIVLATGRAVFAGRLPVGPVIERAAKLLRAVKTTDAIHLDDVTAGLLPSRFRVREDGDARELVDEEHRADVARTVLGRTTRFVGRDAEMGALTGLFAQVDADAVARAAIVTGAPGLGKSRLRQELLGRLRAHEATPAIWMGSADALGSGAPYSLVARVLRDSLASDGDDRARLVERIAKRVPANDVERVATFIAEMIGAPLDASPAVAHAAAQLRAARREPPLMTEQIQRAFVELLRGECEASPIVVVLEDAQWGDAPSMKLLDVALRELAELPLLVVAFARPEVDDAFPGLWSERSVLRLALGALNARAAERLARDVLGSEADASAIRRLVDHAAGNPFFLEELVRAFASGNQGTMPETLLAIVQKRLEALDDDGRRLLRAASVFGGVFWRGAVAALLGNVADGSIEACLRDVIDREIVVRHADSRFSDEQEYAFRHALVRDAAYEMLPDADRLVAHRFAAEWLERAGEPSHVLLAEHFERAADRTRAARSYAHAATQALHADDLEGCLRLAKRGFALAGDDDDDVRGALHLARAEAHHWRAEFADAHAESIEAVHLLDRGSDAWFAATAIAVSGAVTLGRKGEAIELARDLARAADGSRPAFLAAVAQCVAFLVPLGAAGEDLLALLPDDPSGASDALVGARVHVARATRAHASGDAVAALDEFVRAADDFERAGHLRGARAARGNAGYASTELGRHEEAESILRAALDDARRAGALGTVAWSAMHLGIVLARLGRASEALALEGEAADLARKQGNKALEADVAIATAEILLASGAADLAIEKAERARSLTDTPALSAAAASVLAHALSARGRTEEALVAAKEAVALLDANEGLEDVELAVRLAHAEALHATGDVDGARSALSTARGLLDRRANAIVDAKSRARFLERVPINARILQLAATWLESGP